MDGIHGLSRKKDKSIFISKLKQIYSTMDIDKLVKGVQIIFKQEMKEERKKLSLAIKEAIKRETAPLKKENKKLKQKIKILEQSEVEKIENRPVKEFTFMDDEVSEEAPTPKFSSNPVINEVLAQTAQGYKPNPNNVPTPQEQPQGQQPINEVSGNPEDAEEWPTMKHNMKPQPNGIGMSEGGAEQVKANMRAQMESEFKGQGGGGGAPSPNGLGVNTGLAALDRVLNRDNSELVKKMEQSKKEPFRPGNGKNEW